MLRPARLPLFALLALSTVAACRRKPAPAPAPAPVPAATDDSAERARREREEREAAERRRLEEERLRAEREAAERARAARATLEATIHFEFDRSDLDAAAREALDAKLPVLQANPGVRIRVAGHTDARGSDEYNLALGQRRAAAAKRYLTQRGIDAERIEIASLGEEQATCGEETEECWARNRRDEFAVASGTVASAPARQP
jgi:peptidoglycan-associated lipoprotein